jgi:hypothetical protein
MTIRSTSDSHSQITATVADSLARKDAVHGLRAQQAIAEDFLSRHPQQFIRWLTYCYPLTNVDIEKYQDYWDWELLSRNPYLHITDECVERFENRWNISSLIHSMGSTFPWSVSLLRKHSDKLVQWTLRDIDASQMDFDIDSRNPCILWTEKLIAKYEGQWNWEKLSGNSGLPWTPELINRYGRLWNWANLSCNRGMPWSAALIDRYTDRWSWDHLSTNEELPWSEDFIEKYKEWWNWQSLTSNRGLPWTPELVVRFSDYWDWTALPLNDGGFWSEALLEIDPDRWDSWIQPVDATDWLNRSAGVS